VGGAYIYICIIVVTSLFFIYPIRALFILSAYLKRLFTILILHLNTFLEDKELPQYEVRQFNSRNSRSVSLGC